MKLLLPSKQVMDYAESAGWVISGLPVNDYELFSKTENPQKLYPQDIDSGRFLGKLPQDIGTQKFMGFSYYPFTLDERTTHAFWDCLGERTFKPSSELLLSVYASRMNSFQISDEEGLEIIRMISQGKLSMAEFPHTLFDRWDITIHEPNTIHYDGDKEPLYAGRFILENGKLKNRGFFSQESFPQINTGYWNKYSNKPTIDTILTSPDVTEEGSFFQEKNYVHKNMLDDKYAKVSINRRPLKNINNLLVTFSTITDAFKEGIYNHEHEEHYDFRNIENEAIALGEATTNKPSKLRLLKWFSRS